MRHLVLLASVYALVCALVLPGSILAQDEPATDETTPAAAPPPEQPATPAPAAEAAPAPAAPAPPAPQVLADETAEAPAPKQKAIAAASGGVTIADFSSRRRTITINQGDTVTWINNGPTAHSATAQRLFNTGILKAGQSARTPSTRRDLLLLLQPHPFMKGTIVVQASQAGGTPAAAPESAAPPGARAAAHRAATASQADSGPTLPNTGGDSGPLLVLGRSCSCCVAVTRSRGPARRRIGW